MRRAFGEAMMSAGALGLLLVGLVLFDSRVREQISLRFGTHPSAQLTATGQQVHDLTSVIIQAVRDQSIEHAPLMIFVVAGSVLLLFMLRT